MGLEKAIFAGGCFWCTEAAFDSVDGVVEVLPGYTGGSTEDPTYEEVSFGNTGHAEAVMVTFDPGKVSYEKLLDVFWRNIDPTDPDGQFIDSGTQYRTEIFYLDENQKRLAEASKRAIEESKRFDGPILTEITKAGPFYPAEEYHRKYHVKNPDRYARYSRGSRRKEFFRSVWGDEGKEGAGGKRTAPRRPDPGAPYARPADEELKGRLTPLQFMVTRHEGTERPFANAYWNEKREGIYVDVVSGEPLFSSLDKFDSGTGWPSFTRPIDGTRIVEREDVSLGMARVEVRSGLADSHLGHLFEDGPEPTGMRYCINSAALRFIPAEELDKEGYGDFKPLFEAAVKTAGKGKPR